MTAGRRRATGRVSALFAAVGAARVGYAALVRRPPGEPALWERKNAAGRVVDLYAGPGAVVGCLAASAFAPSLPGRTRAAAALAVAVSGGCGLYDDMVGSGERRGFAAHLSALRAGEVTSGAVKLLGIGAARLTAGALLRRNALDGVLAGVVIAGSAHVVNLLDVAPGRAAKAVVAAGAPGLLRGGRAGVLAAAPVGAAGALLGDDLAELTMLGDCGAHALGAALGVAIASSSGRAGLALHAAALAGLTVVGDRRGGLEALWRTPVTRWVDGLGRLPGADSPVRCLTRPASLGTVAGETRAGEAGGALAQDRAAGN